MQARPIARRDATSGPQHAPTVLVGEGVGGSSFRAVILKTAAIALLCLVPVAACGNDDQALSTGNGANTATTTAGSASADAPKVTVPSAPATKLEITDLKVGDGAEATPGSTVTVNYIGVGQKSGKVFDSSYGQQPATFPLDQVIKGWTDGIPGMKVGGRRQLVIPGDQAYGANPPSADISPNETLVFIVDLLAVK